MARGGFAEPQSVRSAGAQYRDRLDSARGFVMEMCLLRVDPRVNRTVLYNAYRRWCQGSGKFPISAETFYARIRSDHLGQIEEKTRRGSREFGGIGLLDHERREDDR